MFCSIPFSRLFRTGSVADLVDRTKPWATEGSKVGQEKTYKDSLANALNNAGNVVNAAAEYGVILISQMYDQTTGLLLQNLFYNSDFGVTGKESASFPLIQQLFRLEKGLNDKQEFLMTATNGIWLESSSGVQTEFMEVRGQLLKYPRSGLTELVAKYKALEGKGKVTAADRDAMVAEFMASGSDAYKKLNGTLFKGTSGQQLVAASLFLSGEELRALCYLNTENMERQAPEFKEKIMSRVENGVQYQVGIAIPGQEFGGRIGAVSIDFDSMAGGILTHSNILIHLSLEDGKLPLFDRVDAFGAEILTKTDWTLHKYLGYDAKNVKDKGVWWLQDRAKEMGAKGAAWIIAQGTVAWQGREGKMDWIRGDRNMWNEVHQEREYVRLGTDKIQINIRYFVNGNPGAVAQALYTLQKAFRQFDQINTLTDPLRGVTRDGMSVGFDGQRYSIKVADRTLNFRHVRIDNGYLWGTNAADLKKVGPSMRILSATDWQPYQQRWKSVRDASCALVSRVCQLNDWQIAGAAVGSAVLIVAAAYANLVAAGGIALQSDRIVFGICQLNIN